MANRISEIAETLVMLTLQENSAHGGLNWQGVEILDALLVDADLDLEGMTAVVKKVEAARADLDSDKTVNLTEILELRAGA